MNETRRVVLRKACQAQRAPRESGRFLDGNWIPTQWLVEVDGSRKVYTTEEFNSRFIDADQYEREQRDKVIRELMSEIRIEWGFKHNPPRDYEHGYEVYEFMLRHLSEKST